jgi:hypothetical protein
MQNPSTRKKKNKRFAKSFPSWAAPGLIRSMGFAYSEQMFF